MQLRCTQHRACDRPHYSTKESGHGREEIRNYLMICDISNQIDVDNKWEKLKSIGMVESVRTENGKTTVETRYYISSLNLDAKKIGESVRVTVQGGAIVSFLFRWKVRWD